MYMTKIVKGIGRYEEGVYDTLDRAYHIWVGILVRVTNPPTPCYEGCDIAEEWRDYQTFAEWYYTHWQRLPGVHLSVDKDLLIPGNRIYGPEYCVMIPKEINSYIVGCTGARGYSLDSKCKTPTYRVYLSNRSDGRKNTTYIGRTNSPEEAARMYREAKQSKLTELAEKYKYCIEPRAYEALINFHF